uniref:Multidrug and toxin extrusion protein n=1 Tax=Sinocyclocheilus anshuiensis TaxID=1608454 RepID=A0A671NA95_9TELE
MDVSSPRTETSSMEPSSKLFCCRSVRRCIPLVYRQELYHILCMTGPLVASRILNYLLPFVITMFCGRLGNSVLAGYGMASATINITTAATGGGLALAADTLISQTYGGKNLRRVGIILQRSVLILLIFCLPCWGLLINTQPLLLLLGQDPEVDMQLLYHFYSRVFFWLLYFSGSAAANTISQVYICVFLYLYIRWKKLHVETWGGWSCGSLQEWDGYMKLAIPSTMMLCFEWWIYEVGGFLAGMLGELDLAAQHAVIMLAFINYMFPLGIQGAACVRVGNALGAGDTAGAIRTSKVSLSSALAVLQGLVLASTKTVIGFLFTSDGHIVALVSKLLNIYCVLQFFDGLCVSMGILLGSGQQKIAAVANFFGYYCIGLPLGTSLMFAVKLDVVGFWLGLLICVCVQSSFFIAVIFKINWERVTKEVYFSISGALPIFNGDEYMSMNSSDQNEEPDVEEKLSTAQLILRRGLTTLAALLILAVGIAVHLTVPLPEVSYAVRANTTLDSNFTTPSSLIHSTSISI